MNLDRFGEERCAGYHQSDYELCPICVPDGKIENARLNPKCDKCGGYGEIPKGIDHANSRLS